MICKSCHTENVKDAIFCKSCGTGFSEQNEQSSGFAQTLARAKLVYAGFWRRFIAICIDIFIIGSVLMTVENLLGLFIDSFSNWLLFGSYFVLLESSKKQATLGKMLLGVKVVDAKGNRVSFGRALVRYLAKIISGSILMIGYLMAAFTEKKQALHDIIASSLVVKKS